MKERSVRFRAGFRHRVAGNGHRAQVRLMAKPGGTIWLVGLESGGRGLISDSIHGKRGEMSEALPKILKNSWLLAGICLLAAFFAYYPSLDAKLVWDDSIVQIEQVPRIQSVSDAFFPPKGIPQWASTYYRPLVALTYYAEFAANLRLNGSPHNPRWGMLLHFDTMLFHALCAALISLFAFALLSGRRSRELAALVAGLAFAVNPVHAESVAFVSGRSDSLATLFLLAALLSALKSERSGGVAFAPLSALAFFLALLSKEVAASGLLLLLFMQWFLGRGREEIKRARFWLTPALWAAAFALYWALRVSAGVVVTGASGAAVSDKLWNLLSALGFYTIEVLYPFSQSPYIPDFPPVAHTLAGIALFATFAGLALWQHRRGENLYLFCLLWFLAALGPSLSVVFYDFSETRLAERYLYLPSAAYALALGALIASVAASRVRLVALAGVGALFTLHAAASYSTASSWRDDVSLWKSVLRNPALAEHSLPWTNLASQYVKLGMDAEAEGTYLKALKAREIDIDGRALTERGLGQIYFIRAKNAFERGDRSATLEYLLKAESHYAGAVATGYPDWGIAKDSARTRLLLAKLNRSLRGYDDPALLAALASDLRRAAALNPGNQEVRELTAQAEAFAGQTLPAAR